MVLIGGLAQLVLATVLALSGLSKLSRPSLFVDTMRRLGFPAVLAGWGAAAVIVAELATATGLVVAPRSGLGRAAVMLLASGFAGAGLWARVTRRRVACHCFGPGQHSTLGVRQVVVLPGWLLLCLVGQLAAPSWTASQGLGAIAFVLLGGVAVRLVRAWPLWREVRADRISLR